VTPGRVLRCTIATAARGSSLDFDAVRTTTAALCTLGPDVGAVLLASEGPDFCTGGDLRSFAAMAAAGNVRAGVRALADELHELVRALVGAPVPVVAAVRGWAAGAGMSLVLAADVAVAGTSTRLRPAYPAVGALPGRRADLDPSASRRRGPGPAHPADRPRRRRRRGPGARAGRRSGP
jgi:2-(1,2-epoxy-1,2-dihydrophenyl)acetyl-CoA isomerase